MNEDFHMEIYFSGTPHIQKAAAFWMWGLNRYTTIVV